jgi:hypothetical protein
MQTMRFLFTILAIGSFAPGLSRAGEPPGQASEEDSHENHPPSIRLAGKMDANKDHADQPRFNLDDEDRASETSRETGSINGQIKRAPLYEMCQPWLKRAAPAAKAGLMMNLPGNHPQPPARLPVGNGTSLPWPGPVRGRGAAAAVIGGAAASSAKTPAALNGAGIKRMP